jgi:hypothetical protein
MQGALQKIAGIYPKPDLVANGTFADDLRAWSGTNWVFNSGTAGHNTGSTANLSQSLTLKPGYRYRLTYTVTGRTAGSVIARLFGGTSVSGATVSTNVTTVEILTANPGNNSLVFSPGSTFDGSIDNVSLRRV